VRFNRPPLAREACALRPFARGRCTPYTGSIRRFGRWRRRIVPRLSSNGSRGNRDEREHTDSNDRQRNGSRPPILDHVNRRHRRADMRRRTGRSPSHWRVRARVRWLVQRIARGSRVGRHGGLERSRRGPARRLSMATPSDRARLAAGSLPDAAERYTAIYGLISMRPHLRFRTGRFARDGRSGSTRHYVLLRTRSGRDVYRLTRI
jgi:hypothetical protein